MKSMHYSSKSIKIIIAFTMLNIVLNTFVIFQLLSIDRAEELTLYTRPLHLSKFDVIGLELIGTDETNDIAYYISKDMSRKEMIKQNVYLSDDTQLTVIDVTAEGFYLDIHNKNISAGMSGSAVWYGNTIIGAISTMHNKDLLYCIWTK